MTELIELKNFHRSIEVRFFNSYKKKIVVSVLRRIYTTFVLGTALQNSGTRVNRFGNGPLDLHDKICSSFFSVDFSNGTPKTRTALLNL